MNFSEKAGITKSKPLILQFPMVSFFAQDRTNRATSRMVRIQGSTGFFERGVYGCRGNPAQTFFVVFIFFPG